MKAILAIFAAMMLQWAGAQDTRSRNAGPDGNATTTVSPFLFGCINEGEPTMTLTYGSANGLVSKTIALPGATEVELTDLERIGDTLIAAAGHCTGCSEPARRSVFILLLDLEMNELETLFLEPAPAQGRFRNAGMVPAGDRLYLSFSDDYLGGMRHLRVYDLNLNLVWPEAQQLSYAERP